MDVVKEGYEPFCQVVEVTPKRFEVQLLVDDGVPRTPALQAIVEFLMGMTTGEVEKKNDHVPSFNLQARTFS